MKKKAPPKTAQPKPAPRMTRREARAAARLSKEQRETREVFRERMKNAPPRVRVRPVRTKGYYRFAKEYPSDVGADGFRENRPPAQKLSRWGKALAAVLCVAAFCLAFIGTKTAMLISAQPGDTDHLVTPADATAERAIGALRFTAEELAGSSPDAIANTLAKRGCNTALFEFKDAEGYIPFPTPLARGAAGDNQVENAWETVKALESRGVRTAAYISCFRDSAALAGDPALAIRNFDDPEVPLYDADGSMWLDPYLPETTAYLTGLIAEAIDGGFSYVVLDNVCFPYDLGLRTAYFHDVDIAVKGENSILLDFLADALDVSGSGQLVVLCDVNGIAADDGDSRYSGSLLTCGAELFAVDVRLSMQPKAEPDPLGVFAYQKKVPTAFILSACNEAWYAAKNAEHVDARILACVERGNDPAALADLLSHTGLNDYIIW